MILKAYIREILRESGPSNPVSVADSKGAYTFDHVMSDLKNQASEMLEKDKNSPYITSIKSFLEQKDTVMKKITDSWNQPYSGMTRDFKDLLSAAVKIDLAQNDKKYPLMPLSLVVTCHVLADSKDGFIQESIGQLIDLRSQSGDFLRKFAKFSFKNVLTKNIKGDKEESKPSTPEIVDDERLKIQGTFSNRNRPKAELTAPSPGSLDNMIDTASSTLGGVWSYIKDLKPGMAIDKIPGMDRLGKWGRILVKVAIGTPLPVAMASEATVSDFVDSAMFAIDIPVSIEIALIAIALGLSLVGAEILDLIKDKWGADTDPTLGTVDLTKGLEKLRQSICLDAGENVKYVAAWFTDQSTGRPLDSSNFAALKGKGGFLQSATPTMLAAGTQLNMIGDILYYGNRQPTRAELIRLKTLLDQEDPDAK